VSLAHWILDIAYSLSRFHEDVKQSLERRKADVVQIGVPMTPFMKDIHGAIIQCIEATLSDLKRSNTEVSFTSHNRRFHNNLI
jgi:DNA excision repair protein ERCC-4